MSEKLSIGLLGFGEVGQILASDLASSACFAYDLKFGDAASVPSLAVGQSDTVMSCLNAVHLGRNANIVISAVTAAQTLDAVLSILPQLKPGTWVMDMNSASPGTKCKAARCVEDAGGYYVEAAVMSPISPKRLHAPILLGGPHAAQFKPIGEALGFGSLSVFSDQLGKASAAKMCRSVMVKGIEALLSESLISARHYGVEATVLTSLNDLFPGPDWPKLAHYMIGRTLEHGQRRAEEMREVAKTIAETGLEPQMSTAIANRQDWAKSYPELLQKTELEDLLDALVLIANDTKKGSAA
ncbi:MAG: 6-phosphogluconate dehydrogenase [Robiginitomaculum sp.]|nr:MAG: 6-phosphogluconate dehydrogenase [Robiginitomaculum sp.]